MPIVISVVCKPFAAESLISTHGDGYIPFFRLFLPCSTPHSYTRVFAGHERHKSAPTPPSTISLCCPRPASTPKRARMNLGSRLRPCSLSDCQTLAQPAQSYVHGRRDFSCKSHAPAHMTIQECTPYHAVTLAAPGMSALHAACGAAALVRLDAMMRAMFSRLRTFDVFVPSVDRRGMGKQVTGWSSPACASVAVSTIHVFCCSVGRRRRTQ